MKPTLQTIADTLGVSRATVSNAFSRPDQLSADLRALILSTARELNYPGPNPIARSLRRGRVGAVGVLFTAALSYAFADPYSVLFLRGLAEAAERHRSGLLLLPLSDKQPQESIDIVRDAVVDGFCVYCVPESHPCMPALRERGLPVVSAEQREDAADPTPWVGIDEAAGTASVARHVAALGHRRVAAIGTWFSPDQPGEPSLVSTVDEVPYFITRERLRGYRDGLGTAGRTTLVRATENSRAAGAAAAALALDQRPTAILAISDLLALGVLDALAARGLRAGVDVSVAGFDDIPEAATAGLTTVRQPAVEKGRLAGEILFDPPADRDRQQQLLTTELIPRTTTGPAPEGGV